MKTMKTVAPLLSLAALLAACGGSSTEAPTSKSAPQAMRSGAVAPAASYTETVQTLYMGFFGRPGDAKGLAYWNTLLSDRGLPTTLSGLTAAYATDTNVRDVVDAFANSTESQGLYVANNASFINAVYLNAFNRNAEVAGRDYWSGVLDRGEVSRGQAVLWILSGGQGSDAVVMAKKVQAATVLTSLLKTVLQIASYSGDQINEAARALFGTITATTDEAAFRTEIDGFVATLGAADVPYPVVVRYVGFYYLQGMNNAPLYTASYSYSSGGIVGPANNGKLTYGATPQTVTWSRDPDTHTMTFAAPVVASANLPATALPPALTMLCTAVPGASGNVTRSSDVLVARSARQLLDAAELAGQTLSVYREDCAVGGSHLLSMVFDAAGNGKFTSASGTLTLDAKTVTGALNGQVLLDLSTNRNLVFTAYRYSRIDGTPGYAIVQHLGNRLSGLNDGVLAIWAQE
jgi:hypothetical protein